MALAALAATPKLLSSFSPVDSGLLFHTVERGDLAINVIERGNLESQQEAKIFCEVDDIRGDGIEGTAILWIAGNGEEVKEGDLLVEFDSSGHRDQLDSQILETEEELAQQIQAEAQYKNQLSKNETAEAESRLAVKLAELQLKMFEDPTRGTQKLEADEIRRQIDDTENEVLAARASLKLAENEKNGIEALFKLGYSGRSEVDRARLDHLQAQSALAAKINRLETQLATLQKKQSYEREMALLQFKGDLATTVRAMDQVQLNNQAELAQAKARLDRANRALEKEREQLERFEEQLENCKIYAPQDGMVAYAVPESRWSRNTTIEVGATIRDRQHILSLPNLRRMQVKTSVHESVQNKISQGLSATIRLDAFPDRSYTGTVQSVDVLPDQGSWYNSDTKMYKTIVSIDEEVESLKPGMTAVVEIHVDRIQDVLTLPVQAVSQEKDSTFCYVDRGNGVERQDIQVGPTNEKFVVVEDGLSPSDRVVLNPLAVRLD